MNLKSITSSGVSLLQECRKSLRHLARLTRRKHLTLQMRRRFVLLRKRLGRLLQRATPVIRPRLARALSAAVFVSLAAAPAAAYDIPSITDRSPAANTTAAISTATIDITFSSEPKATTATGSHIRIFGSQTGLLSTRGSFSGGQERSFDPDVNFKAGELISISVFDVENTFNIAMDSPEVYSFRVAACSGTAQFDGTSLGTAGGQAVATGDLDGDGDLDALLVGSSVHLLRNDGNGSFSSSTLANDGRSVALGDLDGDGDLDAIVARGDNPQDILLNNGDGSFSITTFGSGFSSGVAIGDLDGDGDLDAIIANTGFPGKPQEIWLNTGDSSFLSSALGSGRSNDVVLGDLDSDGDLDAFIAGYLSESEIWKNNGDGSFVVTRVSGGSTRSRGVDIGDLDGDGHLDLILAHQNAPQELWRNNGNGSFEISTFPSSRVTDVRLGDLDGDGDLDALFAGALSGDYISPEQQIIWQNNGDASFSIQSFGSGSSLGLDLGDLDGDGAIDALLANHNESQEVLLNGAVGTLAIHSLTPDCHIAGNAALPLSISGTGLNSATAKITVLSSGGQPTGTKDLDIGSASSTSLQTTIPAGFAATSGTLTLTLTNSEGEQSTSLTIHPAVAITGASCACPASALVYSASPAVTGATHTWTINGGRILSGQGSDEVHVEWDQGAGVSISVLRTYPSGCTSASVLAVEPKSLEARFDGSASAAGKVVTLAVLTNDLGSGLKLLSVGDPDNGSAVTSGNKVVYTPDSSFTGLEIFPYQFADSSGCQSTGHILIGVGRSLPVNLEFIERQKNGSNGVTGLRRAQGLAVSPDGRHLYIAGKNDHSLAVFARSSTNGSLSFVERKRHGHGGVLGIQYITDVAVSPDNKHVYASGFKSNAVAVFARSVTSGSLSFVEWKRQGDSDGSLTIDGMKGAQSLALSPDGKHVYVAGRSCNSVAVFSRDAATGALSYVERQRDGVGGVDGLRTVQGLALSPDGAHLYAAGAGDKAVAVFRRNASTGALSFIERHRDGKGGVDGLNGAAAVAVSANGHHLVVAGAKDNAVAVFSRNDSSGRLRFVQRVKDSQKNVGGLAGAFDVALSPDDLQVYVAGSADDALVLFGRDACSGELDFIERQKDGKQGVDGLRGSQAVALSPNSRYVYATGGRENAVAVFSRNYKPLARPDDNLTVNEFSSLTIEVLDNDFDPDGHSLSVTGKTNGAIGTVSITSSGTALRYTSILGFGPDSFTYTISDGHGGSSTATVSLLVEQDFGPIPFKESGLSDEALPGAASQGPVSGLRVTPNPVSGQAEVIFRVHDAGHLLLRVIDMRGREVARLADSFVAKGEQRILWNGVDDQGQSLAQGSYFMTLESRAEGRPKVQSIVPLSILR